MKKLKDNWFNKNIENSISLFTETKYYQEKPFMKPYTTFKEIENEWQHIKNENIKKINFKILAIDDYKVIVEWYLEQNDDIFDGIYEIHFNNNLKCIYFKSWEMKQ